MSQTLSLTPTITLPNLTLPTTQTLKKIFRTQAFTIASELFALITIFVAVGIWVFMMPQAY
jgi:hypothetical protein